MRIGAHTSAAGGPYKAVERGLEDRCEAIQIFVKNANRWTQRPWREEEARRFIEAYEASGLRGLVAHASYLINLCATKPETLEKSRRALKDELERCAQLQIPYLVFHPGSHLGRGEQAGLEAVAESLQAVYAEEREGGWREVTLLFENTAGQGTNLGYRLEHLGELFERVEAPGRFGVCVDTCHAHAAGYDLREEAEYEAFWAEFDELIGLERLKAFHLNDSKRELNSRVDRHEHISLGEIGQKLFERLVNDERFNALPALVETAPDEHGSFAHDVALLKRYRSSA